MKKLSLFFLAAVLSMSMFADPTYSGKTKAQAVPYDWNSGIFVESTAGVGKWYVVMLRADQTDYPEDFKGPFDANGKTIQSANVEGGLTNINVMVVNPLNESATIDVIAYIGDNETSRHFTLGPGGFKAMTFGAGMFIKMGIDRVYLYLVMDVDITPTQAAAMDAVNVNVQAVESENVVSFVPEAFDWTNWPNKTAGTTIPANKETWVEFDFGPQGGELDEGNYTYKFYVDKADGTPITINAGLSYDCPATSIQEQSQELKSASTAKVLDAAKLAIMPKKVYVRIKAPQALTIYAEQVGIPAPAPGTPALFNKDDAVEVKLYNNTPATVYSLNDGQLAYKVAFNTLKADTNYYRQIEVTNHEDHEITIVGKATKTFDVSGDAYSAVSKSVTIPSGATYVKKIDKTMQSAVGSAKEDTIWAVGPAYNVTFKLTQQPNDPEYCQSAVEFDWTDWNIQNGGFQWYEVDIDTAKNAKADIVLTMETINPNEEANITVDLAAACALGEPTQSYTGKSKSTTKTISYSLFEKNENSVMYVRVRTDKNIKVKAELLTTITWDGTTWKGGTPDLTKSARIEGNLTIQNGETIKALGLTLTKIPNITPTEYYTITIEKGGKLIVGEEGIKGSDVIEQIIVEDGGMLLISPKAGSNNKPFVTVKKGLFLGEQDSEGATLDEYHEFIALPIENRQAGVGQALRYMNWDLYAGWNTTPNGFRHTFEGYNVFTKAGDASYTDPAANLNVAFKGQLAANKNVKLNASQWGWFAFGNSWTAPIALEDIYDQIPSATDDEEAVHFYVAKPTEFNTYGITTLADNYYLPATKEIAQELGITEIKPMQGFFLYTEGSYSVTLDYSKVYNAQAGIAAPAPKRKANGADNRTKVAAVLSNGTTGDFVYMIEGEASNAHKMISEGVAIYAEDGLGQVANSNLIGTILSIKTNDATEYTLSFTWLKGETLYIKDLENNNVIAMTAENQYTFTAEPNTVSERFQIIGRYDAPTGMENNAVIEGANKRIENGNVVIIKNGVKYNVLGTQL